MVGVKTLRKFAAVAVAAFCLVSPAFGALDMFLKIDGIEGNSEAEPGLIDVLAYSHGMSFVSSGGGKSSGVSTGKATFQDLAFTIYGGDVSPKLMEACAMGAVIPKVKFTIFRPQDERNILTYELENVLITSMSTGASGGEDRRTENLTMTFTKIKMESHENPEGDPVIFQWDLASKRK